MQEIMSCLLGGREIEKQKKSSWQLSIVVVAIGVFAIGKPFRLKLICSNATFDNEKGSFGLFQEKHCWCSLLLKFVSPVHEQKYPTVASCAVQLLQEMFW